MDIYKKIIVEDEADDEEVQAFVDALTPAQIQVLISQSQQTKSKAGTVI